jgi:uncharacterized protein YjbI with pentapeptide repeats
LGVRGLVQWKGIRYFAATVGVLLLLALVAYLCFKVAPDLFADTKGLGPKGRADARQGVRTASLALLAGAVAVVGALYTARTYELNRKSSLAARRRDRKAHALDATRQVTERFTRAVDQLGSEKLDVRLGGIYALERIARDSKGDHPQIVELLSAFIREHASLTERPEDTEGQQDAPSLTTDVQAALTVLGRRKIKYDRQSIPSVHLAYTYLRGAVLIDGHFERAGFRGAYLQGARGASLRRVHLKEAHLREAHLEGAGLSEADMEGAILIGAYLENARLDGANLRGANLTNAHLDGAALRGADLRGADCRGARFGAADLRETQLDGADLRGADLRSVRRSTADPPLPLT